MNNNNIIQIIEANRTSLNSMMDVNVLSDGSFITLRKKNLIRLLTIVSTYALIPVLIFIMYVFVSLDYWMMAATCPFVILWCIYLIRVHTKVIDIDLINKTVSTSGRWQKRHTFTWTDYQGHETINSVMDFPEEFHIKFLEKDKVRKVKLADVNSLFRKSSETNYTGILCFWKGVEEIMSRGDDSL